MQAKADSSSGGLMRVAADSILRLNLVPEAGYKLQMTPSYGRLESWRLDTTQGWCYPVDDYDLRLWLTRVLPARIDLQLTYTLTYQVNLRTYSAKYIIFIVCFLPSDFRYTDSGPGGLRKLEVAAADSSCDSWFETCDQLTTTRTLTAIPAGMRNVVSDGVRTILQTHFTEKCYSLLQYSKIIALEVLQNDVKYLGIFQKKHF